MAIVARIPEGDPIATGVTWTSETMTIEGDTSLAAGDILLVFCTSEGTSTGAAGVLPDPVAITGITTTLNGGLHPTSFTVSNTLVSSGSDLSSNALSRWIDLGYTAGGYDAGGSPGRNHGGIWGKVLVADDIASSGTQVSVTVTLDQSRNGIARLAVVSGASTDDADLATLVNIARTSMGNTRSSSGTAYDEAEWWGPNATSQTGAPNPDPESNHHSGTTAVVSSSVAFVVSSGQIEFTGAGSFSTGKIISVSGSASNDGLYVINSLTSTILFTSPIGGTSAVQAESAGATVTITSGGYSSGDLGDDFLAMFFTQTPPTCLPLPNSAPIAVGTTRPPAVQNSGSYSTSTTSWNVNGTYPAGWAVGFGRTTPPAHGQSCYWDRQESFTTFDGLWDGTTDRSLNPNRFAWDYDNVDGTNVLWAYGTHLLLLKEETGGTTAGTPVTATGSYAVTSTGTASTATGSYAVKTAGTPVTATGSYAVTSTGTPTTATGDYAVTSTGAVTATGSYAVTSTGTVATATGAYAVTSTGTVTTSTGSYAVTSTGTVTTATGSYAVTAAGTVSTATGSYAVTSTGTAVTATGSYDVDSTTGGSASATGSYAVIAAGTAVTATGAYAILLTGSPVTSTGSYAVQVAGSPVTATGSYSVTSSATSTATGSYAVTAAGTPVTATGSYEVSSSASGTASATGSYAVTSTGTVVTATGAYSVTVSGVTTATGSYAVLVVGTPVSATGSYAITGVTFAGTPAEVFCQYAVINPEHLGYKAFRQLSTLRQRTK